MLKKSLMVAAGYLAALAAVPASAWADGPTPVPPILCANGLAGGTSCAPSKQDRKEARKAYNRGVKLSEQRQEEDALKQFAEAVRLDPQNTAFLTSREVVKARLVFDHMERGNAYLTKEARILAAEEFRAALDLDPDNQFAEERLREANRTGLPVLAKDLPALPDPQEIRLEPPDERATFHFTGDTRSLFTQLAAAYNMTVQFDDSVKARPVTFNVDNVDFFSALKLASWTTKSMWAPLGAQQFLIAEDNTDNHKQFDRMSLQTFVLPPHSTPQEGQDLVNAMRNMFDLRYVSSGQNFNTVEVRGSQAAISASGKLIQQLDNQRPQVMFDIRVYQISHQLTREMGVHIPYTFTLFNIPIGALAALGGQNIQQLINQLIASGGINQAGSTSLSALLAQLTGQQNNIFSQPLATFGGGLTFMGLSLDHFAVTMSLNESWVRQLENLQIRAGQGSDATFHLGERFPILNASYAPIFNSPQIAQVLGNQSYVPPIPSVSYEDLGLEVKANPVVHGDSTVSLKLELKVRSLTGQSSNGVPVISNREYQGSITLKDGEPAFVTGQISRSDTLSMSGLPGLGAIPILNKAMTDNTKQENDDELLIAITPHVLANYGRQAPEIWLSEK
jgi:tetratricopeptide (TPR) repeat protein